MSKWERAFDELLADRGFALSAYAYLLCGDGSDSADLVQEALLRVFARLRAGDDIARLEAYTRRVILNLYLEGRRRHDRWQANQHLLATESIGGVLDEQVLEERRVQAALALLSPRQRACVILRFYDDFSVAAIADELGCGEGTVKRHLADAKVRLADQLGITEESV